MTRYRRRYSAALGTMVPEAVPSATALQTYVTGAVVVGSAACGVALLPMGGWYSIAAWGMLGGSAWLSVSGLMDAAETLRIMRQFSAPPAAAKAATVADEDGDDEWREVEKGHMIRVTAESKRATRFLKDAIGKVGSDAAQLPGHKRMGWGRDAWSAVVRSLHLYLSVNPPGKSKGTYCSGRYATLGELLAAIETGAAMPSPTVPSGGAG